MNSMNLDSYRFITRHVQRLAIHFHIRLAQQCCLAAAQMDYLKMILAHHAHLHYKYIFKEYRKTKSVKHANE